ncbi:MAG TPA: immunoglobulin domain-containing protein [Chitinivibrionales bacterium]|nr:immunoglobulin domain-containing protein [Chitinivibrionales bacterium]
MLAAVLLLWHGTTQAGAPILSGVNPTLAPPVAKGDANPPGSTVSSFLNPIVTNGTMVDDFEHTGTTSKWGGTWTTWSAGVGTVFPQLPFTGPSPGGYGNSQCARITFTLADNGVPPLGYTPYVLLSVALAATPPCDLTQATGFRYWYKGSKHTLKVETTDIPQSQYSWGDTLPSSPSAWKQVSITWANLFQLGNPPTPTALSKALVKALTWVVQQPAGYTDSLLIDNVEVLGFAGRGIAVTGADNTNGAWQYSLTNPGTNWTPVGTVSDLSATLLDSSAMVRFVPNATYTGPATFIFRAWNHVDNKANGATGQSVTLNGGVTAYSAGSATGTVQVQSSNAPVITNQPATPDTVNEGGTLSLSVTATNATTYQWKLGGVNIPGANAATYTKTPVAASDGGFYTVMVKNATDSLLSTQASVIVRLKPTNVTVSPALQTVLVGAPSVTFTATVGTGTPPYTYQWRKDGVNLTGKTGPSITIAPVAQTDGGAYTVVVTNLAGSATSTNAGQLTVNVPVKALFTVSDTIAKVGTPITFTNNSTGPFTKGLWYFGDGNSDTTNNSKPTHTYDSAGSFSAWLILVDQTGKKLDSATITIRTFKDNPVGISGKYLSPGTAQISFFDVTGIATAFPTLPYADSLRLWYKSGNVIPASEQSSTICGTYAITAMQAAAQPFTAPVNVTLAAADSFCGFMTEVHWYNGNSWSWSAFNAANGITVLMRDTFPPVNNASLSGTYINGTDSVIFTASNLKTVDASSVDAFAIWFGTDTGQSTPNFTDSTQTKWFNLQAEMATINATNGRDSITVGNPLFNTGVVKKLYCALVLRGKNGRLSTTVVRAAYLAGVNRPANPIILHAIAQSPSKVTLSWNPVGGVSAIRIWYRANTAVPVGTSSFTRPPFDSVTITTITDTTRLITGLLDSTHYFFGAQVLQGSQWSYVTDSSSANATTQPAGAKLPVNSVQITSIVFDTAANQIVVHWTVDNSLPDPLEIGISYSTVGYPTNDTSVHQIVPVQASSGSATVNLQEALQFSGSTTDTTHYYVALWERRVDGKLTDPTANSEKAVAIPYYNWQNVQYFTAVPGDINVVFNGNILLVTQGVTAPTPTNATIRVYQPSSASLAGFIPVGIAFSFDNPAQLQSPPFIIKIRCGTLPAGYSISQVKIYRFTNGAWCVDRTTAFDSTGYIWIMTPWTTINNPFMALIDTLPISITRPAHSDTIPAWSEVYDTLIISDNSGNVAWTYSYAAGGEAYNPNPVRSSTLTGTSDRIPIYIPSQYASPDNGLRATVTVNDGMHYDTFNVSRQVSRIDSADFETAVTDPLKWVPLRVTAALSNPDVNAIFRYTSGGDQFTYDPKQVRIFRWQQQKWVEYSDNAKNIFTPVPGMVLWIKTKESCVVNFGGGITPSLKNPYPISFAAGEATDFALPFKFNVLIGDILDYSDTTAKNLAFYSWDRDPASGLYSHTLLYSAATGAGGPSSTLLFTQCYMAVNPTTGATAASINIPPIPYVTSKYFTGVTKRAAQKGWTLSVNASMADGAKLCPVYCGYNPALGTPSALYPVPPTFAPACAGVAGDADSKLYGIAVLNALKGNGCTFKLAFVNESDQPQQVKYHLEKTTPLPGGMSAKVFSEATGAWENFSGGDAGVSLAAGERQYRWLVVGTDAFLAKAAALIKTAKLLFAGIYPNPASALVHIRYSVPQAGVSGVKFTIYDLRGRLVWQKVTSEQGGGMREVVWDGTSLYKQSVSAGVYLIRMQALDMKQKPFGLFEKKMTFMPR